MFLSLERLRSRALFDLCGSSGLKIWFVRTDLALELFVEAMNLFVEEIMPRAV